MHGNLKKVPKFSHSHIPQSQWWNCGSIAVMNFLKYHNYTTQLFRKLFLTKLSHNSYLGPCYLTQCAQGPLGYVNALGATRLVHWLILIAPSCLRSHNARYIMLKSLINICFRWTLDTWNSSSWHLSFLGMLVFIISSTYSILLFTDVFAI